LAVGPVLSKWGETVLEDVICVLKLITILLTSAIVALKIFGLKNRHAHLLRKRQSNRIPAEWFAIK